MKTVKPRIASKLYGKIVQVIEYKKIKHRTSTAERIQGGHIVYGGGSSASIRCRK